MRELEQLRNSGRLRRSDLVWKQGMRDWLPAGDVGIFSGPPPAPTQSSIAYPPSVVMVPILVSAISNIFVSVIFVSTCFLAPLAIPLVILCIFEFSLYSYAENYSRTELYTKVNRIGIFEVIVGLLNWVTLICGIIVLVHVGKLRRTNP